MNIAVWILAAGSWWFAVTCLRGVNLRSLYYAWPAYALAVALSVFAAVVCKFVA